MKNQYLKFITTKSFLIIGLWLLVIPALKAQYNWSYVDNYDAIYSVYDVNHFCVKDGAFAKVTQDGGASLSNLGLPASGLLAVQYLSTTEMMALTSAGGALELHHSTDGGASFSSKGTVLDPAVLLGLSNREFFFLDANHGFIFNAAMLDGDFIEILLKTSDGGQSWTILGDTLGFDLSVNMFFDKEGNIFGAAKMQGHGLYVSQDTGKTFTRLSGNIPNITAGVEYAYDGNNTFMVTDVVGSNNDCCYISTDGGNSFNSWSVGTGGGNHIAFNRPSEVLIFGTSDTTRLSTDNGATFNTVRFGAEKPIGSVYFIHSFENGLGFYLYDGSAKLWFLNRGGNISLAEGGQIPTFNFSPNPVSDQVQIQIPGAPTKDLKFKVYSLLGQQVWTDNINQSQQSYDLSFLPAGNYLLRLEGPEISYPAQIITKKNF